MNREEVKELLENCGFYDYDSKLFRKEIIEGVIDEIYDKFTETIEKVRIDMFVDLDKEFPDEEWAIKLHIKSYIEDYCTALYMAIEGIPSENPKQFIIDNDSE